jgi:hypothetical protein
MMPSAPSTQLIGARLAPAQIQNCRHGVEVLSWTGIGSMAVLVEPDFVGQVDGSLIRHAFPPA